MEPLYFVAGALNNYMGRFNYTDRNSDALDRYFRLEDDLRNYVNEYIYRHFEIQPEVNERGDTFSRPIAEKLNALYSGKGVIITDSLNTENKLYSYIAGLYLRYGRKLAENCYLIKKPNSLNIKHVYEIIKTGGTKAYYECLNTLPAQHLICFRPDPELAAYIEFIASDAALLREKFNQKFIEFLGTDVALMLSNNNYEEKMAKELIEKLDAVQ